MPVTLRDGVYQVRTAIGELQPKRWSDAQIIYDLNTAAQEMCAEANFLTGFSNIPLAAGIQEGPLPVELDQIKSCKFFAGQLYDLAPNDWGTLQTGAFTGSIPLWFYTKTGSQQLTPQTIGSDITEIDLNPLNPQGADYYTILGVWPIPQVAGQIHVWYSYFHKVMSTPLSPCAIPRKFLKGWAAYAIARCWQIMNAYNQAAYYEQIYQTQKEEFRIWASTHNQLVRPGRYGALEEPWRQSASSSVILVDQTPHF
jgi:hypothetical protein